MDAHLEELTEYDELRGRGADPHDDVAPVRGSVAEPGFAVVTEYDDLRDRAGD